MDFKDRMIEAYERGWCSYEGSYDFVRESMASGADLARKAAREGAFMCDPDESAGMEAEVAEQADRDDDFREAEADREKREADDD